MNWWCRDDDLFVLVEWHDLPSFGSELHASIHNFLYYHGKQKSGRQAEKYGFMGKAKDE